MTTITIDPVTRIEGHSKITIQLNDAGDVTDARFHVTQLRGFEKLVEGRPFEEMPAIMARICGICPVSHLIASAKACDQLLSIDIPPTAVMLRKIMNLAQMVQSHALSFFYLSSPDLLLGMDAPPDQRNVLGVLAANPELAQGGIAMRRFGQTIIEMLGGKRIHPGWIIPGGVSEPLTQEKRDAILATIPAARDFMSHALVWYSGILDRYVDEIAHFANFPSLFMALVKPGKRLGMYDGTLTIVDAEGREIDGLDNPRRYADMIGEAVEPDSYLKSPYYKPLGYPNGMFRVGPLARLNAVARCGTPLADKWLVRFQALPQEERWSSFHYHYARLIEMLYGVERIEALLNEPDILSKHVRAFAQPNSLEGVGISEAPRGTLLHHYKIGEDGRITFANLIIATGNNNMAMNRGVLQAAQEYIHGDQVKDGMLNRVEAVIRAFDPCLSCSTHAIGKMALNIELRAPDGALVRRIVQD